MGKTRKIIIITTSSIAALLLIAGGLLFAFRNDILQEVIKRVEAKGLRDYGLQISISEAKFSGITELKLSQLSVVPLEKDTLLRIQDFQVQISLFQLIFGNVKIQSLNSSNAVVNIIRNQDGSNIDFLFKKEKTDSIRTNQAVTAFNLTNFADQVINELLYKVPEDMEITNYRLNVVDNDIQFHLLADSIVIEDHRLNSKIIVNDSAATWRAIGELYPSDQRLKLSFFADTGMVEIPYLHEKYGLRLAFDTISTRMDEIRNEDNELRIFGNWSINHLLINHPKISQKDVVIPRAAIDCNMFIAANSVRIDSSSKAYLNELTIRPFIQYTLGKKKYALKIDTDETDAQTFFDAFPIGLFNTLEGIKVRGRLSYHLNFFLDEENPWRCVFNSELKKKDFGIISFGTTNFQKLNSEFTYQPYEFGRATRSFMVGQSNPNFVAIDRISDFLKNALLTSEDPLFFSHRGFYMEAFRQSIATNFVNKKFKRGGSTISMQLVKNVFLSRNKTVARKLEEMIIVWLIENNRLSSKQRMFEVYLNIIEWAPNIYGIGEAARFYFDKTPSQLNLGESIFLASIVPKPKKFKYSFQANGKLKPSMHGYFKFIGGLMVRRGKVSDFDTVNMYNSVVLRGPARNFVIADTLLTSEEVDQEMESLKDLLSDE